MQVKLFYKTQRELAVSLNGIVDAYWNDELNEDTLIKSVQDVYINNPNKMLKEGEFTTVLKQQCGKRRLEVIERIIKSGIDSRS
ncbi:TIGR04540 family protein [Fredinandcohnia sp. SECRCQ15]|uniref:TIGR04540 family protein n=1 Tax=Fredinandcohnia quinoae TaxID=2918902 RepID=A0AAW5EB20_9BACI|nr:TIGR04540 family protein [Fredinandcohnia sp. SECRCQ15]MCH1627231.1 TIGR04540 family protein [Fredinandcohnia sp. SECRCQ15]